MHTFIVWKQPARNVVGVYHYPHLGLSENELRQLLLLLQMKRDVIIISRLRKAFRMLNWKRYQNKEQLKNLN